MNIFASPGEAFDSIKGRPPSTMNWLAPLLLAVAMGAVCSLVVFSQETVIFKMSDAQSQRIQKQVEAGKISQSQADRMTEASQRFMSPGMMKFMGVLGSVIANPAWLFAVGLGLWFLGKYILKGGVSYMKAVETAGLASLILTLGVLISMFLTLLTGDLMKTPGPALMIGELDPSNKVHRFLSGLNLFSIWYAAVLSVGASKISGSSCAKAAAWIFGFWALIKAGSFLLPA